MSLQSRLNAAAKALRAQKPRGVVCAMQWPCDEPVELRELFMCREFDGLGSGYVYPFTEPPARYHWTRADLEAEAARRNVELFTIGHYAYGGEVQQ